MKNTWICIFLLTLIITCFKGEILFGQNKDSNTKRPNIIILFADDMGYGDLGSYGHPTIKTPNIDGLARDGIRFASFMTSPVCVPSRVQLMTGRYPPRVNLSGGTRSDGTGGLQDNEVTLAEGLQKVGYSTGMAGKWHLGYKEKKYLPTNKGFDTWLGLPYSNDYKKPWVQTEVPLGLYRNTEMIEHPVNQDSLTVRYTEEAVKFIKKYGKSDFPFFFYLAYNMPHTPIHTTEYFRGNSTAGLYGDVIQTIDWSVGQVLKALEEQGLTENTIVFFASDNGPSNDPPPRHLQGGTKHWHTGSPGLLRGWKRTNFEGGVRVPAIIRWPDHISPGQMTGELAALPDIYVTFLNVAGADLPDHKIDGFDLMPYLSGRDEESPRKEYAYFRRNELQAYRFGKWKLMLADNEPKYREELIKSIDWPQLYDLQNDPGERWNRADDHPEIVEQIKEKMIQLAEELDAELSKP
jgi:arylsulfatase A-like enzyme